MPNLITKSSLPLNNQSSIDEIDVKHQKIAREFEASLHADNCRPFLGDTHLLLSDYLTAVKMVIDDGFDHEVWVRAEIRSINSKGGHYYFELAEKDDDDQIIASCRATLWRYKAQSVLKKFHQATKQQLQSGISILIRCSASFHEQYGFSLNISDIDPTYTLGELAVAYSAMKKRLFDNGLLELNRSLKLAFDLQNVIVIAPERAAGLGDFQAEAHRLQKTNACHFFYHYATFQGNHAAKEIRQTLIQSIEEFQNKHHALPQLVVIIRGGGSVNDLSYLNDYELAALVAECPVPVWVGIGHERDQVILDEVAHRSFDTPSKVIFGIQNYLSENVEKTKQLMLNIQKLVGQNLDYHKQKNQFFMTCIYTNSTRTLSLVQQENKYRIKQLKSGLLQKLHQQKQDLTLTWQQHQSVFIHLNQLKNHCRHLQNLILIQHPMRALEKGYTLTYNMNNQPIGSVAKLQPNQVVRLTMHDGNALAVIEKIEKNKVG